MHAFINHQNSCFIDTVLVAMFATTTAFDGLLWDATRPVTRALRAHVARLRALVPDGWVVSDVRALMGSPWDNGQAQSAVDFLQALLKALGTPSLGKQRTLIAYVPRSGRMTDIRLSDTEDFSVHLAVAGQHATVEDVFTLHETVLPADAESYATMSGLCLHDAPVLIVEIGRNASTAPVVYGHTASLGRLFITVNDTEYTLVGIVCRVEGHYMGFVWLDGEWGMYDDAHGAVVQSAHPEQHRVAPSRYGELFFYTKTPAPYVDFTSKSPNFRNGNCTRPLQ